MRNRLLQALALFPTVDLNWVDDDGYPLSAGITPEPIEGAETLRFTPPAGLELRAGPASTLGHSHDEKLWSLKAFLARGQLEPDEAGWAFHPRIFIPAGGFGSPLDQVKQLFQYRSTAQRYLKRRSLARPVIAWDNLRRSH